MMKIRIATRTAACRFAALWVCLGMLLTSSACMTVSYTTEEEPMITPSQAKRDLGVDYLSTRRTGMAIRELSDSLELDPSDPKTHLWLGEAYRRKGQAEKAEEFLLDSLRLARRSKDRSTTQDALLSLSAMLSQMGRFEDALPHCEALSNDATFSTPWRPLTNCGWALIKLGRLDEARDRLTEALGFFPRFGPALLNLGILEEKQGHKLAAVKSLNKALGSGRLTASAHAEANYRLGEIFVALGKRDQAIQHFRAAAKIAPEADWGSESQAYLDLLR